MNQDTTGFCQIIALVEPSKANAVLELHSTFSYHDISSKTRASASRVIAELWLGSRISFTTSMHAIAAHYSYATLQVIDKESFFARWFGEIHQDIVNPYCILVCRNNLLLASDSHNPPDDTTL